MIEVINVGKNYYNRRDKKKYSIISNINFKIEPGDIIGLVGKNGVGKSTLLSIIASITENYDGEVLYNGENIKKQLVSYRSKVGYVPQNAVLFDELTVKENLDFFQNVQELDQEVKDMIYALELEIYMDKKVKILSGGIKNRVNIAVAMMNNPKILIMDEPLVGISLGIKRNVFNMLKEFSEEGKYIIMSTHELDTLENICSHLIIVKEEGSIQFKPMKEIMAEAYAQKVDLIEYLHITGGI